MCGKIKIKQGTRTIPVVVKDIIRFEGGKGNCCYIFLIGGKSYKITGNIGEWVKDAEIIASGLFVLLHRSHLINYKQVDSYDRTQGATMKNNEPVPLTPEGFDELEKRIFSEEQVALATTQAMNDNATLWNGIPAMVTAMTTLGTKIASKRE